MIESELRVGDLVQLTHSVWQSGWRDALCIVIESYGHRRIRGNSTKRWVVLTELNHKVVVEKYEVTLIQRIRS